MAPPRRPLLLALVALPLAFPVLDEPVEDSLQFTAGNITTADARVCPPEGSGGDPAMNRLKNRDLAPDPALTEFLTLSDFVNNVPPLAFAEGESDRDLWSDEAKAEVPPWENTFAVVQGWLLQAERMGGESCNCQSVTDRDYHLWVVRSKRTTSLRRSVVMEVSPRLLPAHPTWTASALRHLARDKARVRITGWLFWDQEHHEQLPKDGRAENRIRRATLWEIHPVHRIEVFDFAAEEWSYL